jgi:uncharacterized HhH-GPD family protein
MKLYLAGEPAADELLATQPLALLIGMLLDQQVPMEVAFAGPKKLADRLGALDVTRIATMDADEFAAVCATPPAVHRFPGSMARRIQSLCQHLIDQYDGDPAALWTRDTPDAAAVLRRLKKLPGYGDQKARIFLALLGKQLAIQPKGWRESATPYGEPGTHHSVADITDDNSLQEVRAYKKRMKAEARKSKTVSG